MSYPWYANGTIALGKNQLAALRTDENCNTKEIRFRVDVVFSGKKFSFSALTHKELVKKVEKWLAKHHPVSQEVYGDIQQMVMTARENELSKQEEQEVEEVKEECAITEEISEEEAIRFYEENATSKWNKRYTLGYVLPTVNKMLSGTISDIEELESPPNSPIWATRHNQMTKKFLEHVTGMMLTGTNYKDKEILQGFINHVRECKEEQEAEQHAEQQNIEITYNTEKQGIEVRFADKPQAGTRELLKENGFRWSKRGFWYAKHTDERALLVESLKESDVMKEAAATEEEAEHEFVYLDYVTSGGTVREFGVRYGDVVFMAEHSAIAINKVSNGHNWQELPQEWKERYEGWESKPKTKTGITALKLRKVLDNAEEIIQYGIEAYEEQKQADIEYREMQDKVEQNAGVDPTDLVVGDELEEVTTGNIYIVDSVESDTAFAHEKGTNDTPTCIGNGKSFRFNIELEDETEQQDEKEEFIPAYTDTGKVKINYITFGFSESSELYDGLIAYSWEQANTYIRQAARAKHTGGYDKTDFTITYTDGEEYSGRIDIQRKDADSADPLGEHVRGFVLASAGLKKPAGMTEEDWRQSLETWAKDSVEPMKHFAEHYDMNEGNYVPKKPEKKGAEVIDFTSKKVQKWDDSLTPDERMKMYFLTQELGEDRIAGIITAGATIQQIWDTAANMAYGEQSKGHSH